MKIVRKVSFCPIAIFRNIDKRSIRQTGRKRRDYNTTKLFFLSKRQHARFTKHAEKKCIDIESLIERRLDVWMVQRSIGYTIFSARQYICHRKVMVNNMYCKRPSRILCVGDCINIDNKNYHVT
ncbi:S4 domain-containing protein [Candidatus Vidania fulgoroideorum]